MNNQPSPLYKYQDEFLTRYVALDSIQRIDCHTMPEGLSANNCLVYLEGGEKFTVNEKYAERLIQHWEYYLALKNMPLVVSQGDENNLDGLIDVFGGRLQ